MLNSSLDAIASPVANSCLIKLAFDLPEAIPYITSLRKTVRCLLESIGISEQDIDDLELIIGELATNAVRHAKGGDYHVAIEFFGDHLTVTVTDNGKGFIVEDVEEPGTSRPDELSENQESRVGGFGLMLVRSLSDHMDIVSKEPNGMIIRLQKKVHLAPYND